MKTIDRKQLWSTTTCMHALNQLLCDLGARFSNCNQTSVHLQPQGGIKQTEWGASLLRVQWEQRPNWVMLTSGNHSLYFNTTTKKTRRTDCITLTYWCINGPRRQRRSAVCFLAWFSSGMSNNSWILVGCGPAFCSSAWVQVLVSKYWTGSCPGLHEDL